MRERAQKPSRPLKKSLASGIVMWFCRLALWRRRTDAGRGRAVRVAVQLRRSRSAGWQGSSAENHSRGGQGGPGVAFAVVFVALCADGSPLDSAREAAAGDAVAGVLHDPLGAAVDGAARVRSPVSLVRRYGR